MKKSILSFAFLTLAGLLLVSCGGNGGESTGGNVSDLPDTNLEVAQAAVKIGSNALVDGTPLKTTQNNTIDPETEVIMSKVASVKAWDGTKEVTLSVPLTWSLDEETVESGLWTLTENEPDEYHNTYIMASKEYVVDGENDPQKVVLTCTATWAEETASQAYNISVNVTPPVENIYVQTPVSGESYKLGFYQGNRKEFRFFNGATANTYYLGTVDDFSAAVDVLVTSSGEGWTFLIQGGSLNGKYISTYQSGTHYNISTQDDPFVWELNTETGAYTATCGDSEVYMGTYDDYTTLSVSTIEHMTESSSFIAHLYDADPAA